MGMREYLIKRIIQGIVTVFVVISINFFLFRAMPGNPFMRLIESQPRGKTKEMIDLYIKLFGLDKPLWEQYLIYIKNLLTGNFGYSLRQVGKPVSKIIMERLPNTLILMGTATTLTIIIGIALGVIAAGKRGQLADTATVVIGLTLYSIPIFWLGLLFILVFGFWLGWFPLWGMVTPGKYFTNPFEYAVDYLWHMTLPCTALVLVSAGGWALITRNALLDVFTEDYILTARAKGLDERTVFYKHALRNAMLPLVTMIALSFGFIASGAVLTETVFSWYGIGRLLYEATYWQDYPVVQAAFFIIAVCVIAANIIADILYAYLDPRVKY